MHNLTIRGIIMSGSWYRKALVLPEPESVHTLGAVKAGGVASDTSYFFLDLIPDNLYYQE